MRIKADYRQFVAEDAGLIAIMALLMGAVPVIIRDFDRMVGIAMTSLAVFLLIILLVRYVLLVSVKWMVEDETLCRMRGVFSKQTDYIEMYRITDYMENQSFLQRLFGVKTVTVGTVTVVENGEFVSGQTIGTGDGTLTITGYSYDDEAGTATLTYAECQQTWI